VSRFRTLAVLSLRVSACELRAFALCPRGPIRQESRRDRGDRGHGVGGWMVQVQRRSRSAPSTIGPRSIGSVADRELTSSRARRGNSSTQGVRDRRPIARADDTGGRYRGRHRGRPSMKSGVSATPRPRADDYDGRADFRARHDRSEARPARSVVPIAGESRKPFADRARVNGSTASGPRCPWRLMLSSHRSGWSQYCMAVARMVHPMRTFSPDVAFITEVDLKNREQCLRADPKSLT
jgi:hypothetical protein